jgi:hypothetical protein
MEIGECHIAVFKRRRKKKKGDTQLGETITGTKKEKEKINCSV